MLSTRDFKGFFAQSSPHRVATVAGPAGRRLTNCSLSSGVPPMLEQVYVHCAMSFQSLLSLARALANPLVRLCDRYRIGCSDPSLKIERYSNPVRGLVFASIERSVVYVLVCIVLAHFRRRGTAKRRKWRLVRMFLRNDHTFRAVCGQLVRTAARIAEAANRTVFRWIALRRYRGVHCACASSGSVEGASIQVPVGAVCRAACLVARRWFVDQQRGTLCGALRAIPAANTDAQRACRQTHGVAGCAVCFRLKRQQPVAMGKTGC